MDRLRARHWLAVTTALVLVVAASRIEAKVELSPGTVQALTVDRERPPNDLALVEADAPTGEGDRSTTGADAESGAESNDGQPDDDVDRRPGVAVRWFGTDLDLTSPGSVSTPTSPYTGLPAEPGTADRSALVLKIDNHPRARPQTALDMADIVFDLRAEGVTRFAAVFQSVVPDPAGPIRSSRTSDFDLLRGLDTPLYGSSGGNDFVTAGLRNLPIVELTNRTRNEYFRDFNRPAPHNLYINASELYALAGDDLPDPEPWFDYRQSGEGLPITARQATGPVTVSFTNGPVVTHEWDEVREGWLRTQDGRPHTTVDGDQLAPENVLIFVTDYSTSAADPISPEVRSTGSGELVALTGGSIIRGTWQRPTPEDKPTLTDALGNSIRLTPGRTWVLFPENGQVDFATGQRLGPAARTR